MKVSIITVCYNSSRTISKTIESVLGQTYNNIEYIIIDGNSSDDTIKIIKEYSNKISKWISEPDNGIYDAMNKGISLATGDIIGILNSDDIYFNEKVIERVVDIFHKTKSDLIYGNIQYVNENNQVVRSWKSKNYKRGSFLKGWHPPHPSLFVKAHIYHNYGLFDSNYKIAADFDLMLRFFEKYNVSNFHLNSTLVSMLIGGASNTPKGILEGNREIKSSFKKYDITPSTFYLFYRYLPKIYELLRK